ncbi:putative cryptochrome DASH [Paramyrothecium foliicola]|nr:putative cryptochrome DASH [Paramyrothecium foliicola]
MTRDKILIYLLRRDLRLADNPILHHLATTPDHGFSHLLPIFVFPHHQVEISGFLKDGAKSPYPPAVSQVGKFWRCGPHRAKFLAHSVWDLKTNLEEVGSGLVLRVGSTSDVLKNVFQHLKDKREEIGAVWMTEEKSSEEIDEQTALAAVCAEHKVEFKLWQDEKYFIDDRDTGLKTPQDLPDIFTSYRKMQEPLRSRPRQTLPRPDKSSLPSLLGSSSIAPQDEPFIMGETFEDLESRLLKPLQNLLANPPPFPKDAVSAHPFKGGETEGIERVQYLVKSGHMSSYKETRNGLVGPDFSTKLSAYLALGCVTARQIHHELIKFEDGRDKLYAETDGFGHGENDGTKAIRFELLWRDYMRLCTMKFGPALFRRSGFRRDGNYESKWKTADKETALPDQNPSPEAISGILQRFLDGTTGMGLIDASQRELFHTGYTSNRARQNVASFFSKHLEIDWRYGAEWYEMFLVDYDVSSNWSNWQYVAGVGNDPRGDARIFNPIKQAFDYDKDGTYVRNWLPELKGLEKPENLFQVCTTSQEELEENGLSNNIMVKDPIKRIEFTVERRPRSGRKTYPRKRGNGRGGGRGRGGGGNGGGDFNGFNGGGGYDPSWDQHSGQYHNHGHDAHNGHMEYPMYGQVQAWGYAGGYGGGPDNRRNSAGEWYGGFNGYNNGRGRGNPSYNNYGGRGSGQRRGGGPPRGHYQPAYPPTIEYMPPPQHYYPPPNVGPTY